MTAAASYDSCLGYGQPQTAHTPAKITKVKDLALIVRSVSLTQYDFIVCQKIFWASIFVHNFLLSQPFNEMFLLIFCYR